MKPTIQSFHPLVLLICIIGGGRTEADTKLRDSSKLNRLTAPVIQVFQRTNINRVWNETLWETVNTNDDRKILIVENMDGIRLSCSASGYPVRWILEGLTGFRFLSGSVTKSAEVMEYEHNLTIDRLGEPYTGKYICDNKEFGQRSSVFIFIPGNELFVNHRGKNIYFSGNTTNDIMIPCGVSHPDVGVTLQKSNEDLTELKNVTMNVMYNPKEGFRLKPQEFFGQIEGKYFCVGHSRGIVRVVEYNLIQDNHNGLIEVAKCSRDCEENARCKLDSIGNTFCECNPSYKTFDSAFDLTCLWKCKSDGDCPSSMSCQPRKNSNAVDNLFDNEMESQEYANVCRNPCIYLRHDECHNISNNNTLCKVQDHKAIC